MTTIDIYGQEDCPKCEEVKALVEELGLEASHHSAMYHTSPHEGWQEDGSMDVMAHAQMGNSELPFVRINGTWFRPDDGMEALRALVHIGDAS